MGGRETEVPVLPGIFEQVRVHEHYLIAPQEVLPRVISILLRVVIPHTEI